MTCEEKHDGQVELARDSLEGELHSLAEGTNLHALCNGAFLIEGIAHGDAVDLLMAHLSCGDIGALNVDVDALRCFLDETLLLMRPNRYHNLDHALNTMFFGSTIVSELGRRYEIDALDRFMFLLSLLLHDIGHPGLNNQEEIHKNRVVQELGEPPTLEEFHSCIARRAINAHGKRLFPKLSEEELHEKLDLIGEMIHATDILKNEEIVDEFNRKYLEPAVCDGRYEYRLRDNARAELGPVELKMAIKLADLNTSFKSHGIFDKGSEALWQEIYGNDNHERTDGDYQNDLAFLRDIPVNLSHSFALVFPEFGLLERQALDNMELHSRERERRRMKRTEIQRN
jgi:hypothetical protein